MRRLSAWKGFYVDHEIAFISIGSNMGNRLDFCLRAVEGIRRFSTTKVTALSSFFETEPLEMHDQGWFINGVVAVRTGLSPSDLLTRCQEVETALDRKRTIRYGPRTMDLDILIYGQRVIHSEHLVLPHAKLHRRRFVLTPLAEIAPEVVHPGLHQSVAELLERVPDDHRVRRLPLSGLRNRRVWP